MTVFGHLGEKVAFLFLFTLLLRVGIRGRKFPEGRLGIYSPSPLYMPRLEEDSLLVIYFGANHLRAVERLWSAFSHGSANALRGRRSCAVGDVRGDSGVRRSNWRGIMPKEPPFSFDGRSVGVINRSSVAPRNSRVYDRHRGRQRWDDDYLDEIQAISSPYKAEEPSNPASGVRPEERCAGRRGQCEYSHPANKEEFRDATANVFPTYSRNAASGKRVVDMRVF